LVPGKIKDFLIRNRRRKKNRNVAAKGWQNRAYVKMALNRIYTDIPSVCGLPIRYCDISNTNLCSMQEFLEAVAGASVIVTTRLHVCILSHLLSKRAYVTFGGCMPYKIKGVYEFSLKDDSNIKMLPYSLSESV
jgi:exopolysaccharide biosynthesis predicted pyruvyltransferase EpsI